MKHKRIIVIMLCAFFAFSAVPFGVSAKEAELAKAGISTYEVGTYDQLRELLKSQETLGDDYNIILTSDIYQKDNENDYELIVPPNRNIELDLNGYGITRETQGNDMGLFRVKSDAKLHIFDSSSAQTGFCTFSEGYSAYHKAVFLNEGGSLKITGGYYEILSPYQQGECSVIHTTSGITEIFGGTFDSSTAWGGDTISVGHDAYFYEAPQVYIFGGDFYGKYQSIDISPVGNFLGFGSLFPNVFVLGGNFYVCNKGTDKIKPSFTYCNNGWGRVIIAEGTVYATSLNIIDQRYLKGSEKKLFSQTVDGFTGGYYEVSAPPMIMPSGEDKYGKFYYERLALLCSKELTRNYNEETYLMYKVFFDSIRGRFDTIYVDELETESPQIKLINRTSDMFYINWYVCDEADYNGENTKWTYLGNYDNVVQWQLDERPENATSTLVRCVVTKNDYTSYEDIIRIEYAPLKTTETITSVELTGLTSPANGANPDFDLTVADEGYYINNAYWTDITDTSNPDILKETDTFKAGHKYAFEVWLRANDYYKFRVDSDDYIDITATIDTREAEVSPAGTEVSAILRMEFSVPESEVVSEVDVINVDTPYAGRTPDYDAHCTTKGCNVKWVKWYDVTDGGYVLMGEDDTFVEGRTYRVNVMVETEGDYTFLMVDRYNEAWGYINGMRAIAGAADEDFWLQLGYIFPACEGNIEIPTEPTTPDEMPTTPTETTVTDPTETTESTETTATDSTEITEATGTTATEPAETTDATGTTATEPAETTEATETTATEPAETTEATETTATEATTITETSEPLEDKGILGDVNGDGKVNVKDATMIQKAAAKIITLTDAENIRANVNGDTKVNVKDATAIQKYAAKINTGFPIGKPVV